MSPKYSVHVNECGKDEKERQGEGGRAYQVKKPIPRLGSILFLGLIFTKMIIQMTVHFRFRKATATLISETWERAQ